MNDLSEGCLIVRVDWVVEDEQVVISSCVVHVAVLGDQLDAVDSNVDTKSRLAVPVEVRRLRDVSDACVTSVT